MAETGLSEVGVQLVVRGTGGFTVAMNQANQAVITFGQQATRTAGAVAGSGGGGGSKFSMAAATGIFTAVAMHAINAIYGLVGSIGASTTAAFQNAVELQNLTISLESLAAREQLASGEADNMTQALEQAGPVADELLDRIKALSIASPFEYQDVVGVFRLNMAFGQTADTSLKLTKAITDIAAASGQGAMIMQRLAYNFSQMSLTGQVTMRDVRDLAMAGFDLSRVFREELSMSVQEVNSALKAGKLTMQDVSNAFVTYADENFGGAAERMSRTFTGVMSSLKDLAFFASTDVLGGALNNISTAMANIFDRARAITDSGVLQVVGVIFEVLTSRAAEASEKLPTITDTMLTSMGDKFMAFAESSFDYGLNIMTQFANGIIDGASFVIDAVLWVVQGIANLLMPGSPPRALPDIDKWGTATFLEYLKGFADADFSVLKSIQQPIQAALSLMNITGPNAASIYGGFSQAIAKMLTTGTMDMSVFTRMAKGLGEYGKEIADLAKKEVELALAMREVDNARKNEEKAWTDLQKKVFAYNKAVKEGAGAGTLAALRAQVDTAQATFTTAQAEREATEERYSNIDAMKEQVDVQKQIVDQLLDIARMQKKALSAGGAGAGGGFTAPTPVGGGISAAITAWEKKIAEFRDRLKAQFDKAMTDIGTHFKESSVGKLIDAIKQALFGDTLTLDPAMAQGFLIPGMDRLLDIPESKTAGLQKLLELLTGKSVDFSKVLELQGYLGALGTAISTVFSEKNVGNFLKFIGAITGFVVGIQAITAALGLFMSPLFQIPLLIGNLQLLWGSFKELETVKKFIDDVKMAWQFWTDFFKQSSNDQKVIFAGLGDAIKKKFIDVLVTGFAGIVTALKTFWDTLKLFVGYILGGNFAKALALLAPWIAHSPAPMAVGLSQIADEMNSLATSTFPRLTNAVNGLSSPMAPAYSNTTSYNVPITVNATVNNNQDIHQLAYVIAREFNQRTNR